MNDVSCFNDLDEKLFPLEQLVRRLLYRLDLDEQLYRAELNILKKLIVILIWNAILFTIFAYAVLKAL